MNTSLSIVYGKKTVVIYYKKDDKKSEALIEKEINSLKASIERRKNLLNNENYVSKAPSHLVEEEREKLLEEERRLLTLEENSQNLSNN